MGGSSISIGADGVGRILLGTGEVALFDACDFELLSTHKWVRLYSAALKPYIFANMGGKSRTGLAPIIMGTQRGEIADHINGDTLDNRRANLRVATITENNRNTIRKRSSKSPYKGVRMLINGKWSAYGTEDRRHKHLGTFPTAESAAHAYDEYARIAHGDFACLNFPVAGERSALTGIQIELVCDRTHSEANHIQERSNHG